MGATGKRKDSEQKVVQCAQCHTEIHGPAEISDVFLHATCAPAYKAAARGLLFRCPACSGSGWEYNREVHDIETYDPSDGYAGWFSTLATRVVTRHESKHCDLCNGKGFLNKEPVPIIQPAVEAKVIGWRKP